MEKAFLQDIHSGVGAADQYMSSVQAAAYGLAQGGDTKTKLLCGVVTDSAHDGYRCVVHVLSSL